MTIAKIDQILKEVPSQPGIYRFFDVKGKIIYIGKATNLKNRVKSYFQKNNVLYGAKESLVENIAKINWQTTESEAEALILEANLIKKHQPKFNVLMRDDKSYFYVAVSNDEFPKIKILHKTQIKDGDKLIGPFTDGTAIKQTLKLLRKTFVYCTCKSNHPKPCLNYHIGKCLGICCIKSGSRFEFKGNKKQYLRNIRNIVAILTGKKQVISQKLQNQMDRASKAKRYEDAAIYRNQLFHLQNIFSHQKIFVDENSGVDKISALGKLLHIPPPFRIEGYDISNIMGQNAAGSMVVFSNGIPDKAQYRKFKIKTIKGANDVWMLNEIISRRFKHLNWPKPDLIMVDGGLGQLNIAKMALLKVGMNIPIISLAKKNEEIYTGNEVLKISKDLPELNVLRHLRDEAHRFAIGFHRKLRHKQFIPNV